MAKKSKMPRIQKAEGRASIRLYTRVSTDRQAEEGYSLRIQREKLCHYLETLCPLAYDYEVIVDDGYSGGDLERPGIQRIIREAEEDRITHVVVLKLDRLSRSLKDTMHLIEDIFLPHNVAFVSLYESFDTGTPFGRAMIGILSVFAQFERENIFERTRSGMQKRVESGFWMGGGNPPVGYDYDPAQGILVPNADADKVRYIYDRYLGGMSMQAIADELGMKYESLVRNILTRKANAGYIVYNGQEYRGRHEPIISLETYEEAMAVMAERSARKTPMRTAHLLTGLVICGKCGARMRYAPWGKGRFKLVCYSQQKSKAYLVRDPDCDQERPWASEVEQLVIDTLFAAAAGNPSAVKENPSETAAETALQQRLDAAQKKLRRLYGLYGEAEDDDLLEVIRETKEGIAALEIQLYSEQERLRYFKRAGAAAKSLERLEDFWPHMRIEEQRSVLLSVVESITITGQKAVIKLKYGLGK